MEGCETEMPLSMGLKKLNAVHLPKTGARASAEKSAGFQSPTPPHFSRNLIRPRVGVLRPPLL